MSDDAVRYVNTGKTVVIGRPSTERADLSLAVNASAEYIRGGKRGWRPKSSLSSCSTSMIVTGSVRGK